MVGLLLRAALGLAITEHVAAASYVPDWPSVASSAASGCSRSSMPPSNAPAVPTAGRCDGGSPSNRRRWCDPRVEPLASAFETHPPSANSIGYCRTVRRSSTRIVGKEHTSFRSVLLHPAVLQDLCLRCWITLLNFGRCYVTKVLTTNYTVSAV